MKIIEIQNKKPTYFDTRTKKLNFLIVSLKKRKLKRFHNEN